MHHSGPLAVVAAAVLWGTAGTAAALTTTSSLSLAAARLVLGGAVLAGLAFAGTLRAGRANGSLTRAGAGLRTTRLRAWELVAGAAAVAAYQPCFFAAINRTGVAIGTVVAIGSAPAFTGVLSWLGDGRKPTHRWALATAAAVAGCAVLITGNGAGGADAVGIALALLGGLLYAGYAVVASRAIRRGMDSGAVMGVLFGGAALLMVPVLIWTGLGWLAQPAGLLAAGYLGGATTALAYLLYGRGLRTTPVATAATLALAEPAVAALLGVILLREHLPAVSWAGLTLLGLGLLAVALGDDTKRWPREEALGSAP